MKLKQTCDDPSCPLTGCMQARTMMRLAQHVADFPPSQPWVSVPVAAPVTDAQRRKGQPVARGVLAYFPDALKAVAEVSKAGNDQHNPGQPLHWAKDKSTDHADCLVRHLLDYLSGAPIDSDGQPHLGKVAWRALALLQTELDAAAKSGAK